MSWNWGTRVLKKATTTSSLKRKILRMSQTFKYRPSRPKNLNNKALNFFGISSNKHLYWFEQDLCQLGGLLLYRCQAILVPSSYRTLVGIGFILLIAGILVLLLGN